MIPRLLPTVLVAEAPPASGLGPLGVLDCDSGLRLARLDPANRPFFTPQPALRGDPPVDTRPAVASTLGLFERRNLLAEHPGRGRGKGDAWPQEAAEEAWRTLAPQLAGRRVCLVGRAARAAGLAGLPPLRWLRMGGPGEPAEVCAMPHPSGVNRWYNDPGNRARASAWLAAERKRSDTIARAFVRIPGAGAYHFARGEFDAAPADALRAITECAAGIRRFGGRGLDDLSHSLVVRAALPPDASQAACLLALTHDHHEALVSDLPTPLKRLLEASGDGLWREVEQVAAAAVDRLVLRTAPHYHASTDADREAVKVADQIALRVEARALGIDLGDPADLGALAADHARLTWGRTQLAFYDAAVAWSVQWREDGGAT